MFVIKLREAQMGKIYFSGMVTGSPVFVREKGRAINYFRMDNTLVCQAIEHLKTLGFDCEFVYV